MTAIAIWPENPGSPATTYRATAGNLESVGKTAGEALDALIAQLDEGPAGALAVVKQVGADEFFSADQQQRLGQLMDRWRAARDGASQLPAEMQAELEMLVDAELKGSAARAAALLRALRP